MKRRVSLRVLALLVAMAAHVAMAATTPKSPTPSSKPSAPSQPRATTATAPARKHKPLPTSRVELAKHAIQLAKNTRSLEELGGYAQAAEQLRELKRFAPVDPDLDLALALNLARSGQRDSAAALLYGRVLSFAMGDTAYARNFEIYGWRHEKTYFGGQFDGWYWYVARARAEIEAARGNWTEAREAARICTRARPLAGFEWYVCGLCAARTGDMDEARTALERALRLAPTLPEAHYVAGLLAWRDGRRLAAQVAFRAAIELDSTYRDPAVALARALLPVPPDSLPTRLLARTREPALLTSPARPKFDEFIQLDEVARVRRRVDITIPDSLSDRVKPIIVNPLVLFNERGHAVFQQDPWAASTSAPEAFVGLISQTIRTWEIEPALKGGRPQAIWMELDIHVSNPPPPGE